MQRVLLRHQSPAQSGGEDRRLSHTGMLDWKTRIAAHRVGEQKSAALVNDLIGHLNQFSRGGRNLQIGVEHRR